MHIERGRRASVYLLMLFASAAVGAINIGPTDDDIDMNVISDMMWTWAGGSNVASAGPEWSNDAPPKREM